MFRFLRLEVDHTENTICHEKKNPKANLGLEG